jgi:energy-coupling factor transporter ATP-binding protein EcfA2
MTPQNQQVPREEMDHRIEEALMTVGLNVDKNQYINELQMQVLHKL